MISLPHPADLTNPEKLRLVLLFLFMGIFLGRGEGLASYALLVGGIFLFLSVFWKRFWIGLLAALCLAFGYGGFRAATDFSSDTLPYFHNQTLSLQGMVVSFPDVREKNNRVIVSIAQHNPGSNPSEPGLEQEFEGKLLLISRQDEIFHYGDRVQFTGKLTRPRNFEGFDYQEYLRRFGVQTIVRYPQSLQKTSEGGGKWILRKAESVRNLLAANLKTALPSPHNKIAMGILLGVKNELPEHTSENFKRSGLMHLLVVSGFNVGVVVLFVSFLLRRFGRRVVFGGVIFSLLFFVAMTGAEAPIIRAAVMGGLAGWAIALGRFSESRNLIFLSMVLIGLFNPRIVQTDVGFYLSTIATLGIVIGVPIFQRVFARIPDFFGLRTLLCVTFSAQIAVFPLLGLYFGHFPVVGFIANLMAEPLIPLGMFFSFLTSMLGFLPEVMIQIISIPAFIILEGLLYMAQFFGQFDPIPIPQTLSYIGIALILMGMLWGSFSRKFSKHFLENMK